MKLRLIAERRWLPSEASTQFFHPMPNMVKESKSSATALNSAISGTNEG